MKSLYFHDIKTIQRQAYLADVKQFKRIDGQGEVTFNSTIYCLPPILVEGVLRIGGKVDAISNLEVLQIVENKVSWLIVQPIILPPSHHVTQLLIRSFRKKLLQIHHETVERNH